MIDVYLSGASTAVILIILAGVKPLEEAYRARNQACGIRIECDRASAITADMVRQSLGLRASQIKRFVIESYEPEILAIQINKVSAEDIRAFAEKLSELEGVRNVEVLKRSYAEAVEAVRARNG